MEYKHKDLTDKIINAFYKVYNSLGHGFLEKVDEYFQIKSAKICGLSA